MPYIHESSYRDDRRGGLPCRLSGSATGRDGTPLPEWLVEQSNKEFQEARSEFDKLIAAVSRKWRTTTETRREPISNPYESFDSISLIRRYTERLPEGLELSTLRVRHNPEPDPALARTVEENLPVGSSRLAYEPTATYWSIHEVYGTPYGQAVVVKLCGNGGGGRGALVIVAREV